MFLKKYFQDFQIPIVLFFQITLYLRVILAYQNLITYPLLSFSTSEPSVWKFTFQLKGELISFVKKRADVFTSRSFIIYVDSSIGPEIWDFIEKAFLSDTIMVKVTASTFLSYLQHIYTHLYSLNILILKTVLLSLQFC